MKKIEKKLFKSLVAAFFLGFFALNANSQETKVTKTIKVFDFLDQAVIDANQAQGGLHTVATKADLLLSTKLKKSTITKGMLVVTTDDGTIYKLIGDENDYTTADYIKWEKLGVIPTYLANKLYVAGDLIFEGGKLYIWKAASVNGANFDAKQWRILGQTAIRKIANIAALTAMSNDSLNAGDVVFILDANEILTGDQKGVFIRNTNNTWDTLSIQEIPYILEGKVYYGKCSALILDKIAIKALDQKPIQKTYEFSSSPTFDVSDKYYSFAYPADWSGSPAVYVIVGGNKSQLTDCWSVYTISVDNRDYKVWTTNVDFQLATNTITFEVK